MHTFNKIYVSRPLFLTSRIDRGKKSQWEATCSEHFKRH